MQLDAEEDDNIFYKPPVEPSAKPANSEAEQQAVAVVNAEDDD